MTNGRLPSILIATALGVGAFAYLMSYPPTLNLSDESFVLYSAKRVLNGEVLYRDIFEFITPLFFWTFAAAYAIGGVTLHTAKVTMALANAGAVVLTYALSRRVAGRVEAAVAALVYLGVCLPAFRLVSPHWLSTTLCLATASVLLSRRWRDSERLRPFLAGVLGGLVFCTQQQRGTAMVLWLGIATIVLAVSAGRVRRLVRELPLLAAGWLVVTVPILGWAIWRAGWADAYEALVRFVLQGYGPAYVGAIGWAESHLIAVGDLKYTWQWLLRALPWVLAAEAVALGWRLVRSRGPEEGVRASLLFLGATMAASVLYFPDFYHVAFIAPFTLVVAAGLVHRMRSHPALGRSLPAAIVLATVAFGGGALWQAWRAYDFAWAGAPILQQTAFGPMATGPNMAPVFDAIRDAVSGVPAERRTLFAYPNDAWLYLTLPARNPTPFCYLSLASGYSPEYFKRVERILDAGGADFVVVNEWLQGQQKPFRAVLERRYHVLPVQALFYVVYQRNDAP